MTATTEVPARKLAMRHWCALRDEPGAGLAQFHTARNGKARSERCTYCRGPLVSQSGLWCVFAWRGDGRYWPDGAMTVHLSEQAAERACQKAYEAARTAYGYGAAECNVVVRWVPVDAG